MDQNSYELKNFYPTNQANKKPAIKTARDHLFLDHEMERLESFNSHEI